jgi:hypothetical protein
MSIEMRDVLFQRTQKPFFSTLDRQSSKTPGRKTYLMHPLAKKHNSLRVASGFALANLQGVAKQVLGY